jgi:hypothetical protein
MAELCLENVAVAPLVLNDDIGVQWFLERVLLTLAKGTAVILDEIEQR